MVYRKDIEMYNNDYGEELLLHHYNKFSTKEDTMASDWDKIPSIPGVGVDWEYEPATSLGNRSWKRLIQKDLHQLLGATSTQIKMVTASNEMKGSLVDISQKGLGVLLETALPVGEVTKIGFHLGKEKIVSKAVTKNRVSLAKNHQKNYRIGLEFVGLSGKMEEYIVQLVSSTGYGKI